MLHIVTEICESYDSLSYDSIPVNSIAVGIIKTLNPKQDVQLLQHIDGMDF
jgi:hypothetical protein